MSSCFAGTESLQSAIIGAFSTGSTVNLVNTIADDLYLSIAPYGEVRHG